MYLNRPILKLRNWIDKSKLDYKMLSLNKNIEEGVVTLCELIKNEQF